MRDAVTSERLVRLRVLLAGALAAATDLTATGRHVSVVFLDGVCELALHLAADEHDIEVLAKHGYDDVYGMVAGTLGGAWNRRSAKGVRELHRARNNLQHHGVLPDAQHVPIWASEVDRFIHSLVQAAFDDNLATVSAVDVVDADDLRRFLAEAETAITRGEFAVAVQTSKRAMDTAVEQFRLLRGKSTFSRFGTASRLREFQKIDQALDSLEEFVDVAYLAPDPGEWLSLTRIAGNARSTADVTQDQAQRAFSFALSWILRFESFAARYPERSPFRRPEASLDQHYEAPQFAEIATHIEIRGRHESTIADLTLDHIPPEWLDQVHAAFRRLKDTGKAPPGLQAMPSDHGITIRIAEDADPASVRPFADELVRQTHELFTLNLDRRRAIESRQEALTTAYADTLLPDPLVTGVRAEAWSNGHEIIRVQVQVPEDVPARLLAAALNRERSAGDRSSIDLRGGELSFAPSVLGPEQVIPALAQAIVDATEAARAETAMEEIAETRREQRQLALRDAFADVHAQPDTKD
jgi:hypothetical protein